MSLTVRLKNIGILKQAEFSLGDLTLICGENNTGKTYATYALYGFLQSWSRFSPILISEDQIRNLLTHGTFEIELTRYFKQANQTLIDACERYPRQLDQIFAAPEGTFHNNEFHIDVGENNLRNREINGKIRTTQDGNFNYSKHVGSEILTVTIEMEKEERKIDSHFARMCVELAILRAFFPMLFLDLLYAQLSGRARLFFARNSILPGTDCLTRSHKRTKKRIHVNSYLKRTKITPGQ